MIGPNLTLLARAAGRGGGGGAAAWTLVGSTALTTDALATRTMIYPATAVAGDVVVIVVSMATTVVSGTPASSADAGDSLTRYRLCSAGETQITVTTAASTGKYRLFQFRRSTGGTSTLSSSSSATGNPPAAVNPSTGTPPALVFIHGRDSTGGATAFSATLPGAFTTLHSDLTGSLPSFAAWGIATGGTTGSIQVARVSGTRQTVFVFN